MRKKSKEDTNIVNPGFTIRLNPDKLELLKQITGESEIAGAVRDAINKRIMFEMSAIQHDGQTFISTSKAGKMLDYTPEHIRRLAKTGKLTGFQIDGKKSKWLININSVNIKLIPKVKKE